MDKGGAVGSFAGAPSQQLKSAAQVLSASDWDLRSLSAASIRFRGHLGFQSQGGTPEPLHSPKRAIP